MEKRRSEIIYSGHEKRENERNQNRSKWKKRKELFNSKRRTYIQNKSIWKITHLSHFKMNPIEKDIKEEVYPDGTGNEKKEDQLSPLAIAIQNDSILGNVTSFLNVFI